MTWAPAYSARFSKPLLEQTVAIIQRDQAAAIAYYNPALLPIQEFHYGRGSRTAPLWLSISADGPIFIADDDLNYRKGRAVLSLDLDVGPVDQEQAQFNAHDYVLVLDSIIVSAGPWPDLQDWTTSLPITQEAMVPTVLTLTDVAVGSTAVYSYSSFAGPAPMVGQSFTFSLFSTSGNNVANAIVTAVSSGTVTVAKTTQANETKAASGTNAGTTTPPLPGTVKDVKVLSHRFTPAKVEGYESPLLRATLNVQFDLSEG